MNDYGFYIGAAYGFAALAVGVTILRIALDYRGLKQKLARFDKGERR